MEMNIINSINVTWTTIFAYIIKQILVANKQLKNTIKSKYCLKGVDAEIAFPTITVSISISSSERESYTFFFLLSFLN